MDSFHSKQEWAKQVLVWFTLEWVDPRTNTTPLEEFIDNFAADPATAAQFELGRRATGGRHCKAAVAPADLRHALDKLRSSYHTPDSPPEQNALKGLSNRFRR